MRRLLRSAAFVLLLLSSSQPIFAAEEWVEVRSPHFTLITDGGEKRGRETLARFEEMRAGFGVLFNRLNVNIPVPLQIIASRNTKELRRFSSVWNGKTVEVAGFFLPGEDRSFIALDLSTESAWQVVFHEYAHQLINGNLPEMPRWFDEGFADYCSSLRVQGKYVEIGLVPRGHGEILATNRWMSIPDLFSVAPDSREYNESGDRRSVFYAESWLLVHYLMHKNAMAQAGTYLTLMAQHVPMQEAIQRAFGMDAAKLQKALDAYFRGSSTYYRASLPPNYKEKESYNSRPISLLEARATMADLQFHSRDHREEAVAEFEQILKEDPDNLAANRGLGYVYLSRQDYKRASEFFQRAAAKGSGDARVHYLTALLHSRDMESGEKKSERVAEIKTEAQRAIALVPNFADAYNLIGYANSLDENWPEAIQAAQKAVQLAPRNEFYLMNLLHYEVAAKQFDKAEAQLQQLKNSSNPEIANNAARQLEYISNVRHYEQQVAEMREQEKSGVVARVASSSANATDAEVKAITAASRPVQFAKGKVLSVACTGSAADVKFVSNGKPLALHVADIKNAVIIGADKFSCEWRNRAAAVNYRALEDGSLALVSLEVQ